MRLSDEDRASDEDLCAAAGHRYYSDDGGLGRCYCGARLYPAGCRAPGKADDDAGAAF
jgi:hypothetical protein